MAFFGRNPFFHNSDFEELMEQCLSDRQGAWGCQSRPEFFTTPFTLLAPGVIVPQKKPSRPTAWVKPLNLPDMFSQKDVSIRVEDGVVQITASHTFGDEKSDTDTIQATRKVEIPQDVDPDTVKPIWRKRRLFLRGEWRKEEKKEAKIDEEKSEKHSEEIVEAEVTQEKEVITEEPEEEDDFEVVGQTMEDENEETKIEESEEKRPEPELKEDTDPTRTSQEMVVDQRKALDLRLELPSISPENIRVQLVDNRLIIEATQEDESNGHSMVNHVRRVVTVPDYIDVDQIKSSVTDDCVLKIYAPVYEKKTPEVREISIEKSKSASNQGEEITMEQ